MKKVVLLMVTVTSLLSWTCTPPDKGPVTVVGTVGVPLGVSGENLYVYIAPEINVPDYAAIITMSNADEYTYYIQDVEPGTYYLYALADVDGNDSIGSGDYQGFYGMNGIGAPSSPNTEISAGETNEFNFIVETIP